MNNYKVVVTKSTVPVGTAEKVENWIKENQTAPLPFDVVSNPEFLREGSALHDALHPDRVVIGTTSKQARTILKELYKDFQCPIIETNQRASEMIKYASNSFLALKISYINELARLCDILGINVNDVSIGMGLDRRIGSHFLKAGMGYGGSCFPKDVRALIQTANEHKQPLSILEKVVQVNDEQSLFVLKKVKQALGGNLQKKIIAILGLSFKPNTDDTRDSQSLVLMKHLAAEQAVIKAHDPIVKLGVNQYYSVEETVSGADAIVVCTDWEDYKKLDWAALKPLMKQPFIFDGRNMLDKQQMKELGFQYMGIANR